MFRTSLRTVQRSFNKIVRVEEGEAGNEGVFILFFEILLEILTKSRIYAIFQINAHAQHNKPAHFGYDNGRGGGRGRVVSYPRSGHERGQGPSRLRAYEILSHDVLSHISRTRCMYVDCSTLQVDEHSLPEVVDNQSS